jgi:protein Tex
LNQIIVKELSQTLSIKPSQVETVLSLLEENTVPFIARYRKEQTGNLDESIIREIANIYEAALKLENRKADVLRLIEERGMLTDELKQEILSATKLVDVEDLYRPFKEKKKTKATEAIKKGLQGLADYLIQAPQNDPLLEAEKYLNQEVLSPEEALQGAMDIIAEMISDHPQSRKRLRDYFERTAQMTSTLKKDAVDEKLVYQDYYAYETPLKQIKPFRVLALNRGEKDNILKVGVSVDDELVLKELAYFAKKNVSEYSEPYIDKAMRDGYKRLIKPSIEREIRSALTEVAEIQAIHVFGENLHQLLLQPPLKQQTILGVDPAYRTGCKCAVVDPLGRLLEKTVIYPHALRPGEGVSADKLKHAENTITMLVNKHHVDTVAIGNGTASRETEEFIGELIAKEKLNVSYSIVSEAGASVYSASILAKQEFPDLNVEERSAISIARRLQDPLSELVKIDPKSLGVGQYQHDVTASKLTESLLNVVETAVNQVGVNVNIASAPLLSYVAGLSSNVALNIVEMRDQSGAFKSRKELKKVKGLGPKGYEQAIGFLRILDGDHPLDKTSIHPESYAATESLIKSIGCTLKDVGTPKMIDALNTVSIPSKALELNIGELTLSDVVDALKQPLRDPRDQFDAPLLKKGLLKLEDLKHGMALQGTVRNIVDFGAFVDCGVKTDGLVHISEMANRFVKHPLDVVKIGQIVDVYVKAVDVQRQRLQLTMLKERL